MLPGVKTPEVLEALRARHSEERGWVNIEEAFRIDFLAMACHGEYGDRRAVRRELVATHPWVGYEVKVSRSDFRNEIKRPAKRAWAVAITHEFYFCCPAGLVKPGEIPEDCGLVEVNGAGTRITKQAPLTAARPLSHLHLSQMFRHGINPSVVRNSAMAKAVERAKRRQADDRAKAAVEDRDRVAGLLGKLGPVVIEPGQSWTRKRSWNHLPDRVVVVKVGAEVVTYTSPWWERDHSDYTWRFLMEFEPTGSGTMPE